MANEEQLALLRQGRKVWNAWRKAHPKIPVDLSHADLSRANLCGVDLHRANLFVALLVNADMRGAFLRDADMRGTFLRNVDMCGANLNGAFLREAELSGANLAKARLLGADLSRANMSAANVSTAQLDGTIFANNDLSTVIGLDAVIHQGPSTIGIDTLYRSQGRIPESFLRGCGVPETLIENIPSLLGAIQPIQLYSCFISYSAHDQEFAQRLFDRLQGKQLRVWFAPEELKGGQLLDEQLESAIRMYDKLILVLSDASVRSKWVMHELRKARRQELANQRRKLFPIRLTNFETLHNWECFDPETGQDLADEVRKYFIPDFSHWKDHDNFEREFTLLLEALKAVDEPPAPGPPAEQIIAYKKRELFKLREQQAKQGVYTPPAVLIDIEDREREIRELGGDSDGE